MEAAAVAGVARSVPHLERDALLAAARLLGSLAWRLDSRGRRTALENLRVAFPGDPAISAERPRIVRDCYRHFARTFLDLFWAPNLIASPALRARLLRPADDASRPEAIAGMVGHGGIWVTPHFGNFEWVSLWAGFAGIPFMVVAQDFKNPALTPLFRELRSANGHQVISRHRAVLRLARHLARGGHAGFLADLTVPPGESATIIEAFGLKTCVTRAHAALAVRCETPVVTGYCLPEEGGACTVTIHPPIPVSRSDDPAALAQRCWDAFEPAIRARPEAWLWMYKHWRFRPDEEHAGGREYPAYANRSKAFDRLVAASA